MLILKGCSDHFILGMDFLENLGTSLTYGSNATPLRIATRLGMVTTVENEFVDISDDITPTNTTGSTLKEPARPRLQTPEPSNAEPNSELHHDNQQTETDTVYIPDDVKTFLENEVREFAAIQGVANVGTHKITMQDQSPIKQRYYRRNPAQQAIINEKVDELLEKNCIEPSTSPYSAPVVLVRKKSNQWRMCVDYRQLNERSVPDAYPLPRIHQILDRLRNARYISSLDLKDGYWQIAMDSNSRRYTAFTVPGRGLYQWKVMPFGLHSAPATF